MLSRDDIGSDLARGETESLQDSFDAVVAWDGAGGLDGIGSAAELMALFKRVCGAVKGCMSLTPPETPRALASCVAVGVTTATATYDGAARSAFRHSRTWWPSFAASFPDEGREDRRLRGWRPARIVEA